MSPPSLDRVLWGESPGVGGTTGRSDSSRPSGPPAVSLGGPYLGQVVEFALREGPPVAVPKPGRCCRGTSPVDARGDERRPTFLGNPVANMPCSLTPAALHARPLAACRCCLPRLAPRRRRRIINDFGARWHGLRARCLRFTARVAPRRARLASGWRPALTGRGWIPAGFREEFRVT